jgi:hypothetical protein
LPESLRHGLPRSFYDSAFAEIFCCFAPFFCERDEISQQFFYLLIDNLSLQEYNATNINKPLSKRSTKKRVYPESRRLVRMRQHSFLGMDLRGWLETALRE